MLFQSFRHLGCRQPGRSWSNFALYMYNRTRKGVDLRISQKKKSKRLCRFEILASVWMMDFLKKKAERWKAYILSSCVHTGSFLNGCLCCAERAAIEHCFRRRRLLVSWSAALPVSVQMTCSIYTQQRQRRDRAGQWTVIYIYSENYSCHQSCVAFDSTWMPCIIVSCRRA